MYPEEPETRRMHQYEASGMPSLSTEDSWNHLEHRVPHFNPGFVAFGPSTPPHGVLQVTVSPSKSSAGMSRSSPKKKQSTKGSSKVSKVKEISWQHTVVMKGGLKNVMNVEEEERSHRSFGVRKGALDPEAKEKARKVRKLKACWACWVLKVPVSNKRAASVIQVPDTPGILDWKYPQARPHSILLTLEISSVQKEIHVSDAGNIIRSVHLQQTSFAHESGLLIMRSCSFQVNRYSRSTIGDTLTENRLLA